MNDLNDIERFQHRKILIGIRDEQFRSYGLQSIVAVNNFRKAFSNCYKEEGELAGFLFNQIESNLRALVGLKYGNDLNWWKPKRKD